MLAPPKTGCIAFIRCAMPGALAGVASALHRGCEERSLRKNPGAFARLRFGLSENLADGFRSRVRRERVCFPDSALASKDCYDLFDTVGSDVYDAQPRAILTELKDGTGLLLHLGTKVYFTLNETAVFLWKELASGSRSRDALVESLVARYETSIEVAARDVDELLAMLLDEDLVRRG